MKIKTILLIVFCLIIAALIGANIYDFYKPVKAKVLYKDFEVKSPSIEDTIENYRFLNHFDYDVAGHSVVSTYIFKDDLLIDSAKNKIAKSKTIDCRAYKTEVDGIHLIYLTAINQDERNSGNYSVYLLKKVGDNWKTSKLAISDLRDSIMFKNIERIANLR